MDEKKKCSKCGKLKDANTIEFCTIKKSGKLTAHCRECDNSRRRVDNMTPEQIKLKRANQRVERLSPERLARKRKRQKLEKRQKSANMTKEEREIKNSKKRVPNLTDEQLEKRKEKTKFVNLSPKRQQSIINRRNKPHNKLRQTITSTILQTLKENGSSKRGKSISNFLSFKIPELMQHLEQLFFHPNNLTSERQVWMTWDNHGKYNAKTWDDHDPATWTWQIDHIIPQSDLPYTSMTDDNFKKAWALTNLRPLSAKQNILDGVRRTRHSKRNGS